MTTWTRAQFRTRVQRRLDAEGAYRWGTTAGVTGEIDQVMGFVHTREWKRLLNANRHFRVYRAQPTTDASGRVSFAALSVSLSSDTEKNAYRIIQVVHDSYIYREVPLETGFIDEINDQNSRVWFREGDNIALMPVEVSEAYTGTGDGIWVNWYPTAIDALSTDTAVVSFPSGYEEIVVLETAAFLASKGGSEPDLTQLFKAQSEEMRQDMLQDLARTSTNPQRMRYEDVAAIWAG